MKSEWKTCKAEDFIEFNPRLTIRKGEIATKVSMDKLQPFAKAIPEVEQAVFSGGSKFSNGDTIMARITPCLENGKTAFVNNLQDGEVAFGSTEFIVMRARPGISDPQFVYYLAISPFFRDVAIKSMIGSSGRQRVQQSVLNELELTIPPLDEQRRIGAFLSRLDDKIELNQKINENLERQAFALFDNLLAETQNGECVVSDIAILNPKRSLAKNQSARCIDMARLPTSGTFPTGWETKTFNGGMKFSNGDTLLARITPCLENGKTAFIDFLEDGEVAFGSTEYIVLSPKEGVPPEFLYCLARYPAFVDYAVKNMNGSSGRQRVSAETIGQYCLPKLSSEDFSNFGEVVVPLFLKMRYNSLENLRLVEMRDTLLPKLMSGELNISSS